MSADILSAEDDTDLRALIERTLGGEYDVKAVTDGDAAWAYLDEHGDDPPDAVILDVMMPRLDGFGVLDRLRGDGRFDAVPVVMLTSRGREDDVLRALDGGADDFIVKPFAPSELSARVARVVERPPRQR